MITDFFDIITSLSASTIRLSIPLILAAMAGMMSERSGIVNVGLEGKMLLSAFAAAATASVTNDAWLGLLAGIAVAV
ncbi:MAG TPA: ABC transporter permease, partial [Alphaproteobacteria bacterium]|nr:ABC transporter permease [Alphaproteobacteria bacterium]